MSLGITFAENCKGIGDQIQFSSLPENYYRTTGSKLIDVNKCWIFDHNPYVDRENVPRGTKELWNFPQKEPWPNPRPQGVYLSNAEIHAARFGAKVFRNRPCLYKFESFPFERRNMIIFHTQGRSHGKLPDHIIGHVIEKYGATGQLFHLGVEGDPDYAAPAEPLGLGGDDSGLQRIYWTG
jgi:hypothetical protein